MNRNCKVKMHKIILTIVLVVLFNCRKDSIHNNPVRVGSWNVIIVEKVKRLDLQNGEKYKGVIDPSLNTNMTVIPKRGMHTTDGKEPYVYVLSDDKMNVQKVIIAIIDSSKNDVIVKDSLIPGQEVVTEGL